MGFALGTVAPAAAQEAAATASPIGGSVSGYSVTDWMNLILRLGLVLVVIWFAIMAMRWWVRRMNGAVGTRSGHLQIVESRSLGPNRSLQLVRLGNRAVLLGVTAEQISSVLEIDDPTEVERLVRPAAVSESPTSLRDAMSRLGSMTKWRPVIERRRPAANSTTQRAPLQGAASGGAVASTNASARGSMAAPAANQRGRWMTLARRVIGLEEPPARRPMPAASRQALTAASAAARSGAAAGRAPSSIAAARATAAELPASRAARARSGYRQNQIAEAQRAITSVREQMQR